MPDANNAHHMTYNGWSMRVRHARQEPARFMLLLHGWTGDENSMWVFARNFPEDVFIAAPRAPHAAEAGGYSWVGRRDKRAQISGSPAGGLPGLGEFKPAADSLIALVDDLSASIGAQASRFDLAGFSQGGALANALALLHPGRINRLAVLAGFMPGGVESMLDRQPLKGLPVFVAHGDQDALVPVEHAREAITTLERAGAQVTFCEAEVGHKVSADCLRALQTFFSRS